MDALVDRYSGVVLDIDGVCVRGEAALPSAPEVVAELRRRGIGVAFATNNSTRTPADVAAGLTDAGIAAEPDRIVTSAQAAVALLDPGTRCLVIGMDGLREPLAERGCVEVDDPAKAETVVVGLDRDATYDDLARATDALVSGARFLGTNGDTSMPVPGGIRPGAGALLASLAAASGRQPEIAGKPHRPLFEAAADKLPDGPVLMVGDRLETDIVGAQRMGWDAALVLTGVTSAADAARARPAPTYVLSDLGGLLEPPPAVSGRESAPDDGLRVRSATEADGDAIVALWEAAGMLSYTPEPERDLRTARAAAGDLVLVAERDGRVVGTLLGTCDGRRGWLQRLAIDPSDRRQGTGRALVAEVERRLADRGVPQANLLAFPDNEAALAFWRSLGYRTRPVEMGTKRLDDDG